MLLTLRSKRVDSAREGTAGLGNRKRSMVVTLRSKRVDSAREGTAGLGNRKRRCTRASGKNHDGGGNALVEGVKEEEDGQTHRHTDTHTDGLLGREMTSADNGSTPSICNSNTCMQPITGSECVKDVPCNHHHVSLTRPPSFHSPLTTLPPRRVSLPFPLISLFLNSPS